MADKFYFKSKSGIEFKFYLITINDRLLIDFSAKERIRSPKGEDCGVVISTGGLLRINQNQEIIWGTEDIVEFDDDIKNYMQKVIKLKVFI